MQLASKPLGIAGPLLQCYKNGVSVKEIKEFRDRAPFKPFSLHLTSRRTLKVATADHLLFSPRRDLLVLFLPSGGVCVIDPAQVASVDMPSVR